jgi:hypothetical protein
VGVCGWVDGWAGLAVERLQAGGLGQAWLHGQALRHKRRDMSLAVAVYKGSRHLELLINGRCVDVRPEIKTNKQTYLCMHVILRSMHCRSTSSTGPHNVQRLTACPAPKHAAPAARGTVHVAADV